jgi:hypothetical protein
MEENRNQLRDSAGCGLTSLLGLLIFGGFCMFMFWVCMKLFGVEL